MLIDMQMPPFFDRMSIEARNAKASGRDVLMVRSREAVALAAAIEYLEAPLGRPATFGPALDRPV